MEAEHKNSGAVAEKVTCRTATPAAPAAVQPPQVLKYSMPLAKPLAQAGVVTTAPMGKPLPIGLPRVTMSGTTPYISNAQKWDPTLPNPTCTCTAWSCKLRSGWNLLEFTDQ